MTTKIKINFKMQSGKVYKEEVDTSKTVDRMLADFLEKRGKIQQMTDYSFMVNAFPLDKKEVLKKPIKHVKKIKPDCTIQVREVNSVNGGLNISLVIL